jgi:hypothetical protein
MLIDEPTRATATREVARTDQTVALVARLSVADAVTERLLVVIS